MFERCPVPTPFPVGPVNAYLRERTIVDPGPDWEVAWSTLRDALAERSLEPADVERVVVTHPHPDHFGIARRFRDRGASVLASEAAAAILADFEGRLDDELAYFRSFLPRHGVPESTTETIVDLSAAFREYVLDCPVDRTVADGDAIEAGETTLTARSVTGHAPGELRFAYESETGDRRAIVGDHVLGEITPNPLLQPPPDADGRRPRTLPAYNDSLAALGEEGFDRLLPGHGAEIDRPRYRIERILESHERRTARVLSLLDESATAYDVMCGLFPDISADEVFGGMSEAIGHLDVLEARGRVERDRNDDRITYGRQ